MTLQTLEVPIRGMDCIERTEHAQHALAALPGVQMVEVFLAAEKAVLRLAPAQTTRPFISRVVEGAGYSVPAARAAPAAAQSLSNLGILANSSRLLRPK